jgi:hypothetical protein
MGKPFDPYHKWLGIPPEEQPPHHYRLLGISLFETDPDVIEAAADQRMAHLRGYQTGRHAELSQSLLNAVAAARVCLLNPAQHAAYDRQLQSRLVADTSPPPQAPGFDDVFSIVDDAWPSRTARRRRRPPVRRARKKPNRTGPLIAVALSVGFAIIALLIWQIASRNAPSASKPSPVRPTQRGQ